MEPLVEREREPTFERTNLVPIALAFVAPDDPGPEAIAFSGRGGDDTLTIAPGRRARRSPPTAVTGTTR